MKSYLIKRKGSATPDGFIKKQNTQNKGYSDIMNTPSDNKFPSTINFKIGDEIFVSEAGDGIYAKMVITELPEVEVFASMFHIFKLTNFVKKQKSPYATNKMFEFFEKLENNPLMKFKYVSYKGKLKILDRVIPFNGVIEKYKTRQHSVIPLTDEDLDYLKSPDFKVNLGKELSQKIPGDLRLSSYGFFGTDHKLGKIIDIDHFVPKSVGAPGNIIENLVPIGLSFNRSKNDSIPRIFFLIGRNHFPELNNKITLVITDSNNFIKRNKETNSHQIAEEITKLVSEKGMEFAKEFYNEVSESFYPTWTEYRNNWSKNNK